ncbi:MAG: hypothetical protein OXM57_07865 [bacterium]|nr:hypothetical protein [bacterium]MDE0352595.1 hypothetical protein [bacterium]
MPDSYLSGRMGTIFVKVAARHPSLAWETIRLAAATAAPGWFRKAPFVPRPEPGYLEWRMQTAYGRPDSTPTETEVEEFLRWRRTLRRV